MRWSLVTTLAATLCLAQESTEAWEPAKAQCRRINIPMCQHVGYNFTVMPTNVNETDQKQAERELEDFKPLIEKKCSVHIRLFLCSVYAPLCSEDVSEGVTSCKSLCVQVRDDCLPMMLANGLEWPHHLNCSRFLESDINHLCIQNDNHSNKMKPTEDDDNWVPNENRFENPLSWPPYLKQNDKLTLFDSPCPPNFVRARNAPKDCAPKCGMDAYYRIEDKKFVEAWFTGWAWLCFLSTLFTLLTFCVDSTRFRYPERPVVFLAMCNNAIAIAYIIRGSCGSKTLSCTESSDGSDSYVAVDGLESASCTFLFLVIYYFSLSSSVWFVNFVFSWYLSAAKKWSTEALENISSYFHVTAWTVPAVFAVAALVLRRVSADELTGLCQITDTSTIPFIVIPHTVLLFAGLFLACLGGAALINVRKAVKMVGRSTSKLERLMSRLIVFGILFIIPALGSMACNLYESFNKPKWQSLSLLAALECQYQSGCSQLPSAGAGVEIALLRLFLSLAGGITTGMWVWSGKTCRVWSGKTCGLWGSLFTNKVPNKPICYRQTVAPIVLNMPKRSYYGGRSMHVSHV